MNKQDEYLLTFTNKIVKDIYEELTEGKDEPEIQKVMPLLLFKTMLDKIHAIKILAVTNESRVGESTFSIARTICECKWYFLYMIKSDTDFKARAYYYFSRLNEAKSRIASLKFTVSECRYYLAKRKQSLKNLQEKIDLYDKAIKENDLDTLGMLHHGQGLSPLDLLAGKRITDVFNSKKEKINTSIVNLETQIVNANKNKREYEKRIAHLKSNPDFEDIRVEVANIPDRPEKMKRLKRYPTWYGLKTHISNVRELANHLGLLNEYQSSYGSYSQDIHILNATKQIRLKEDKAVLKDEDEASNNDEALEAYSFSMTVLSSVVRDFLTHYGKDVQKEALEKNMAKLYDEK